MNKLQGLLAFAGAFAVVLVMGFYRDPKGGVASQDLLKKLRQVPGVIVTEYSVTGDTPEKIRQEIQQRGPKDFYGAQVDAYTAWRISWAWPEKGSVNDFLNTTAEYSVEVTVPRWEGGAVSSASLKGAWEAYLVAILKHERRHIDFVLENYSKVAESVREAARKNPELTTKEAHLAANNELARIRALDRSYDESTQHGRTEGAVL